MQGRAVSVACSEDDVDVQANWWEHFFHGVAVDVEAGGSGGTHTSRRPRRWSGARCRSARDPRRSVRGRPSDAGTAPRYRMTGLDLSPGSRLREPPTRQLSGLEHRDMRHLDRAGSTARSVWESFGYMDDGEIPVPARRGHRAEARRPLFWNADGHRGSLTNLKDRPWFKAGSVYLLVENEYDASRSRLNTEYTFVADGRVDVRRGSQRVYAYRQLIELMEACGFAVTPAEGWTRASHTLTLVGTRV